MTICRDVHSVLHKQVRHECKKLREQTTHKRKEKKAALVHVPEEAEHEKQLMKVQKKELMQQ